MTEMVSPTVLEGGQKSEIQVSAMLSKIWRKPFLPSSSFQDLTAIVGVPWLLDVSLQSSTSHGGLPGSSPIFCTCIPVSGSSPIFCTCIPVSVAPVHLFIRTQVIWVSSLPNIFILTHSFLQRPYFQRRAHSQVLGSQDVDISFGQWGGTI